MHLCNIVIFIRDIYFFVYVIWEVFLWYTHIANLDLAETFNEDHPGLYCSITPGQNF